MTEIEKLSCTDLTSQTRSKGFHWTDNAKFFYPPPLIPFGCQKTLSTGLRVCTSLVVICYKLVNYQIGFLVAHNVCS